MLSFISYLTESIVYNSPDHERQSHEEHDETKVQSDAIKQGHMEAHPAIAKAIHGFAKDKSSFTQALKKSKIEKIKKGTEVNNSEIGQGSKSVEDKNKVNRVKKMIGSGQKIDRPIVLRHKDRNGQTHHHLLAGNTRATTIGYGVQSHMIDV